MENRAGLGEGLRGSGAVGAGQGAPRELQVAQGLCWGGETTPESTTGENKALGTVTFVRGTTRVGETGLQNQFEIDRVKGKINKTTQEINFYNEKSDEETSSWLPLPPPRKAHASF